MATWLILAALAPAAGRLWLLCGDGSLHRTCCCAGEASAESTELGWESPACCSVISLAAPAPSPIRSEGLGTTPGPTYLVTAVTDGRFATPRLAQRAPVPRLRKRPPPAHGPPHFLAVHALLI